jgi:DNA-binding NarL/FixJ family response regulator
MEGSTLRAAVNQHEHHIATPILRQKIQILIADDHPIMREGIKRILKDCPDISVVGEATNSYEVFAMLKHGGINQVVLDLSMPGRSGIELIRQVRKQFPHIPILVLTMYDESQYAIRAIRAGAQGYLNKDCACQQLIHAIRKLASGHPYISFEVAEQLVSNVCSIHDDLPHKNFSEREFQVFVLLVEGKTITAIADQIYLSIKTVSTHKTNLMKKLRIHTISELVQYAIKNNLMDGPH